MSDYLPIIIFAVIVPLFWCISIYNRFVKFVNMIEEAWSTIDVVLKRRANIIPQLVNIVKGYSGHEADTLESVTAQRLEGNNRDAVNKQENAISKSLGGLLAVAEAYPDLKASHNFLELQKELRDIEHDIAEARNLYNGRVRRLNTLVQEFPSNLIARLFQFVREEYFTLELPTERDIPEVSWADK